jgi:hypothetical protein
MGLIKIYRTEKSIVLGVLLWGIILTTVAFGFIYSEDYFHKAIIGMALIFVGVVWFGTRYNINTHFLMVKIGPFTHSKIDINSIKSIENGKGNLTASPANSFNRIAIQYGQFEEILLSPKNREEFFKDLLMINPSIKINKELL